MPTSARCCWPALIVIGLQAFLNKTVTGRAMQAVAQNTDAAQGARHQRQADGALHVPDQRGARACVAALLVTPTYLAKFDMGDSIGQKAFFAAIIGGFNQTRGALLGGVLIGVLENVVGFYVSPAYKEGVALMLFLRRHPVPARGPARQGRGAQGMNAAPASVAVARRRALAALRDRCPTFLKSYGVYLLTLFCVYLMATFGLNLTVGYAGQMSLGQAAFFGIGAYIAAIALKAGCSVLRRAAASRPSRASPSGLALGFPGAARAAPLPRVRDARLQRAGVPDDAQRGEAHRRHVRHLGHSAAVAVRAVARRPLAVLLFHARLRCRARSRCCGGCCARRGAARSRRCATTRSARRASASTSPRTRCWRSRSAPRAPASAACYFAALVQFIEPAPFHFSTSLMMLLAVIVGGSGRFFGPVLGTIVVIVLLPRSGCASCRTGISPCSASRSSR